MTCCSEKRAAKDSPPVRREAGACQSIRWERSRNHGILTPKYSWIMALTASEKRELVYASLVRYGPEFAELRHRALDRVVLGALLDSSAENPFRVGEVQRNLTLGGNAPAIRPEVIRETLERLAIAGKVEKSEVRKRTAYYLTDVAARELAEIVKSTEDLFQPVLRRMLDNTAHLVACETGSTVCRKFICECFARFGARLAKTVTGHGSDADLLNIASVHDAFRVAAEGVTLSEEAAESLKARCLNFIRGTEPEEKQLKFYLAQGFYFLELLGLEGSQFVPLSKEAFSGTVLYLDTNILVLGLIPVDEDASSFGELGKLAKRLNIELRVTRATLDEARRLAANRLEQLNKIVGALPDELLGRSRDQFIMEFLERRKRESTLTPDEFLSPFDNIFEIAEKKLGLTVVEKNVAEILHGRDYLRAETAIQTEAVELRGTEKSSSVLFHDVAHYVLVLDERAQNPKTWFLTRDGSLIRAGSKLALNDGPSFCFPLLGFLQSISPFVVTQDEEFSLADVFSGLVMEHVLPHSSLFEARELALFAEMHEDILSTPQDRLIQAVDYVKSTVLKGRPYRPEDIPKVALALRAFLTCSADEKRRDMMGQLEALASELRDQREEAQAERQLRSGLSEMYEQQSGELSRVRKEKDGLEGKITTLSERERKRTEREGAAVMVAGFLVGGAIWGFSNRLRDLAERQWALARSHPQQVGVIVGVVGVAAFCFPAVAFLRRKACNPKLRDAILVFLFVIALACSQIADHQTWETWTAYLEFGSLLVALWQFGKGRATDAQAKDDGKNQATNDETQDAGVP